MNWWPQWDEEGTPDMTGPDTTVASPDAMTDGAHEAAEIASFLAAEAVANDYHPERRGDDVVD